MSTEHSEQNWLTNLLTEENDQIDIPGVVTDMSGNLRQKLQSVTDTSSPEHSADSLDPEKMYTYSDEQTGLNIGNIEFHDWTEQRIIRQYGQEAGEHISKCTYVEMQVLDSKNNNESVGDFQRLIMVTKTGDVFVEHDNAGMNKTGTGFGSRFQETMEARYKQLGVKAIFRGCGQYVGRYEGAKNGFDFRDKQESERFVEAFCAYLEGNNVEKVTFKNTSYSVKDLQSQLNTPQDILSVIADRPVESIEIERKDRDPKPPRKFRTVKPLPAHTYSADKAGKAFFLDEASDAKLDMDSETDYMQYSIGKWSGVKRLS